MAKWSERPKSNRWTAIGAMLGAVLAGVVAYVVAYDDATIVRYLIMVAGTVIGGGIGMGAATLSDRK